MIAPKRIGIWMDRSNVRLIEFTNFSFSSRNFLYSYCVDDQSRYLDNTDSVMQREEIKHKNLFFKRITDAIIHFDSILLFGSNDNISEFEKILKSDPQFSETHVEIKTTGVLDERQQYSFVKEHFKGI